jgi:mycothiol synthase
MTTHLPPGLSVRSARRDDLQAVVELLRACDIAETGESDYSADALLEVWDEPGFDLVYNSWVVQTDGGLIVGYEDVSVADENGKIDLDGYVHPEYVGQGIGAHLLGLVEARARQLALDVPAPLEVRLSGFINGESERAHRLFKHAGFSLVRHFWRMRIDLDAPPAAPQWPEGISLQSFDPERDARAFHAAVEASFADHWGHARTPFEQWAQQRMRGEEYDPALWLMAMDGEQVAGVVMGYYRPDNAGWVRNLGVLRPWRGRGLGMALLLQAFGEFYRRRRLRVGLGVDAQNPTGATRLYERAGMRVTETFAGYAKLLRSIS